MVTTTNHLVDPEILHTWLIIDDAVWGGEYPNSPDGNPKKINSLLDAGITAFVDLTHPEDNLIPYKVPNGVKYESLQILDGNIPNDKDFALLIAKLSIWGLMGEKMYVHCWGGMGRTSLVAGGLLSVFYLENSSSDIFNMIDKNRKGTKKELLPAPQNQLQKDFIIRYHDCVSTINQSIGLLE